jgi:Ca2+-binding EF-hand superfamily protein
MRLLLSDAFQQFGATRPVSDQDIKTIISSVDKDHDYKITKNELLEIFKRLRD